MRSSRFLPSWSLLPDRRLKPFCTSLLFPLSSLSIITIITIINIFHHHQQLRYRQSRSFPSCLLNGIASCFTGTQAHTHSHPFSFPTTGHHEVHHSRPPHRGRSSSPGCHFSVRVWRDHPWHSLHCMFCAIFSSARIPPSPSLTLTFVFASQWECHNAPKFRKQAHCNSIWDDDCVYKSPEFKGRVARCLKKNCPHDFHMGEPK